MKTKGKGKRKASVKHSNTIEDAKMETEDITATGTIENKRTKKSCVVDIKQDQLVEDEAVAIQLTKVAEQDDQMPTRYLVDFILHDVNGVAKPFEMSEVDDLYITALVMPWDESLDKAKGVRCKGIGRIESWAISGYDEGSPVVWISTELAYYNCIKPESSYKRFFSLFFEKARVCIEVFKKLSKSCGGNPNMSLDELLAGVVCSMSGSKFFPNDASIKNFLISSGEFIYNQLIWLDDTSKEKDVLFTGLPVLVALRDECKKRGENNKMPKISDGSLKIEGEKLDKSGSACLVVDEDKDAKLAQLLQDEEYWNSLKKSLPPRPPTAKRIYVKINEDEISNDYPMPAYYKTTVQEMDEYVIFEDDTNMGYPEDLPKYMLHNWSLYNSDSRLVSLELLPMIPCTEVDVTIFGSGTVTEDDASGFCIDNDSAQSSSSLSKTTNVDGIPIFLSAIKEWMIEFGSSMVFVSIRTDLSWYTLGKPSMQYAPWYEPVLKTARLAIGIITLLKEQHRISQLSFPKVIKKVSEFEKNHPAHISSNPAEVERYVVVHGQIILQQFAEYPDEMIWKCAFVSGLSEKMEERHHTKLVMDKVKVTKEANLNPRVSIVQPMVSKRKAMQATTTKLINRIWGDYYSNYLLEDSKDGEGDELKEEEEAEEEEQDEEDEADEECILVQENAPKPHSTTRFPKSRDSNMENEWVGESMGKMGPGETLYKCAKVHGDVITVGGTVLVQAEESEKVPVIAFVEYMFESLDGGKMFHGRMMQRGCQTVLGNAANEREVFLTNECAEFGLEDVEQTIVVDFRLMPWGHGHRRKNANEDRLDSAKAEERKKKGLPMEYYCKSLYCPDRGAFLSLPSNTIGLGTGVCHSCKMGKEKDEFKMNTSNSSFIYRTTEYFIHDFVYVRPLHFEQQMDIITVKAGRNVGLRPYVVCHLIDIEVPKGSNQIDPKSTLVKIRRFYRPEDISTEKAYVSDIREVYYSEDILSLSVETINGKCEVRKMQYLPSLNGPANSNHIFFCEKVYDPAEGTLKLLPADIKLFPTEKTIPASRKSKGKWKAGEQDPDDLAYQKNRLIALDIFAGCGGLSEGLQKSGVSLTKWAIEYEQAAADAFSFNHPEALMFVENCNVILRAIMEKCGDADDCISAADAAELASKLGEEKIKNLPVPGQVDFINGGPPCQCFSGMNQFNQSTWSKVQCEMILAFLSFADYFRPKYFLLENVRNFICFNKGQTFRLTLASLLEMGYQVRFGVLEAGAYGVSQSRKRAFIWAASPKETLPEWPEPMHVFAGPELKITLTRDVQYAAVKSTARGAPFRSITVRDTLGDLPSVENGASKEEIDYGSDPVSWFQKQIRGDVLTLRDHISKEMNELNFIRCQRIPKRPGADWHDLPDEKVKLSTGQVADLIPWFLPNTAKRHDQWKGLFGRLDWEGNFPTSITDPRTMGKVGMCFHPDQDRILTVRECARSQGFLDSYKFSGNIQSKHKQIGNAVPPPLALALGRKLKEVVDANH